MKSDKVYVVDDEGIVLDSCRRVLEAEGFEVVLIRSAEEALSVTAAESPSLFLIDIKMPVKDGIYLIREVRKKEKTPIIVMSGYDTKEALTESIEAGATLFLPKPFTPDELVHAVWEVFKKKEK